MSIDMTRVVSSAQLTGDSAEDTVLLRRMLAEAERYFASFPWAGRIEASYFGLGVGGVAAVFLFRHRPPRPGVDEWLWVVVGDLPPAYLVADESTNPACALRSYVELMEDWVTAVRQGRPVDDLIPVNVAPTEKAADELHGRLQFLKERILSRYPEDLKACE